MGTEQSTEPSSEDEAEAEGKGAGASQTKKTWAGILMFAAKEVKVSHPTKSKEIEDAVKRYLKTKSPAEEFQRGKTYEFLKYLVDNPSKIPHGCRDPGSRLHARSRA